MKSYKPSSSDIESLYMVQKYENLINFQIKESRFIKIGFYISLGVALVMTIFYSKNDLWSALVVPLILFSFFYFMDKKYRPNLSDKIRQIDVILKTVKCYYKVENGKVYIIQEDGKRIEINQF